MSEGSKNRLKSLGRFVLPPDGTNARSQLDDYILREGGLNNELIEESYRKATDLVELQQTNGSGLCGSRAMREFLLEYNYRTVHHGIASLPSSFNILEAFFQFLEPLFVFKLLPEEEFLLSFTDYFDFFTTRELSSEFNRVVEALPERKVYSYNNVDRLQATLWNGGDGRQFALSSVSMVRHGMEVSMLVVAGERVNLDTIELPKNSMPVAGRERIGAFAEHDMAPVPLEGNSEMRRTIIAVRYDLESSSEDARAVMYDNNNSYEVITDNPDVFFDINGGTIFSSSSVQHDVMSNAKVHLASLSSLLELCKCCIFLPEYLTQYEDNSRVVTRRTEYSAQPLLIRKRLKNDWLRTERLIKRVVTVLPEQSLSLEATTIFNSPDLKIQTSGYWKRLDDSVYGTDKNGNPEHGRTWVRKELTWRESHKTPSPILMQTSRVSHNVEGHVYIARSPAHSRNIWKIGYTTKEPHERSSELSSHTGVPDHFFVAKSWPVSKPEEVERAIHKELATYRLRSEREFFECELELAINVVNNAIQISQSVSG